MNSLLALLLLTLAQDEGPAKKAPTLDAPAHEPFHAVSVDGLNYVWWVPEGAAERAAEGAPPALTVILHGTGGDYRWGMWNNPAGVFRPDNVVVSVDGTSPGQGASRLFLGKEEDADKFCAFLEELREGFGVQRVYLYGHSQGGFFVIYYAGQYPDTVDGVVAHASGAWNWSKMGKKVHRVAIAFLHGTGDPVVPYRQSPGSMDAYAEDGFPYLHLRRMEGYNHWPNATRATEALNWAEGMSTDDPARALALVEELLRPKGKDQYQYEQPPDWAGARMVLRRFEEKGPRRFEETTQRQEAEATRQRKAVEKAAGEQVKALKKGIGRKLALDDGDWSGRFLAVRADFRGTDALEEYLDELGWAKHVKKRDKAATAMLEAWYDQKATASEKFEVMVEELPDAYLYDGFPQEMVAQLLEWAEQPERLDLSKKTKKAAHLVVEWERGLREGREAYRDDWPRP